MYAYIKDNLNDIKDRIAVAAIKSGRQPEEITLVTVTKTLPIDVINAAITFGITDIGENKVQEVMDKYDHILNEPKWHLIGHLQTNKVKYIADKVSLIHSVDSLRLAEEISRRCEKLETVMDILIQINVADESTKFGIQRDEVFELVEQVSLLTNVRIKGLMTIAPNIEDEQELRKYFAEMKDIFETLKKTMYNRVDMTYLSMGMTNDYEIAIEEGANMVRIGTGIFGARNYIK
jgi:pyridoxal phosphate enzyme (YggS family)